MISQRRGCNGIVPSSVYNVLAWIVDNDDRTQQDVPADGRKVIVRNVTTRQQVPVYGT